jgi:hypothetical protein
VARNDAQSAFFVQKKVTELGFAESHCIRQDGFEDRRQLA